MALWAVVVAIAMAFGAGLLIQRSVSSSEPEPTPAPASAPPTVTSVSGAQSASAQPSTPGDTPAPWPESMERTGDSLADRVGPWGRLSLERLNLEPPVESTIPSDCMQDVPDWYFRGQRAETFGAFLVSMGLDESAREYLMGHADCYIEGCVARPTFDLIKQLPPDVRRRLYAELRKEPQNRAVMRGFRCPKAEYEARIANAGLDPATEARLRSLSYEEDGLMRMYDATLLCARSPSDEDRVRIVRTLARAPALMAHLQLGPADDLKKIAAYWNAHGRQRDVYPLLQSTQLSPRGRLLGQVDVMQLLPPMPRSRLDTYVGPNEPRYECIWTSQNFFAERPSEGLFPDMVQSFNAMAERYDEITPPPGALLTNDSGPLDQAGVGLELGDVLVFVDAIGQPMHMASQVAADVVFTKNGVGDWNPWVMMRLPEVMVVYPRTERIRVFRLRLPTGAATGVSP